MDVKGAGDKIIYYRADNRKDEASYIAREIDRLSGRTLAVGSSGGKAADGRELEYRDFAVLYRTNAQSEKF